MKVNILTLVALFLIGVVIDRIMIRMIHGGSEEFTDCKTSSAKTSNCPKCNVVCGPCPSIDYSKYVLKSSIPPPMVCPDMSKYMLKTECPSVPDLSKYVLKSSIPKQAPIILDCSKCQKPRGECPPCPRARCPEVKCPEPTVCPSCAPCPRAVCPDKVVKCRAEDSTPSTVRPYLAPLGVSGYGLA